ncbi:MAG: hypothetical protein KDM81_05120 [Verrucomicrobiae bacterium]|nr:hypothetical protein [Verrucomicrobiae bacterium]MCP5520256.1 hypothetical protein [Verrucomicrobiales bacterium]
MKKWLKILAVMLVLLVVLAGLAFAFFGRLVKAGIQTIGPAVAHVPVGVREADISLLSGAGALRGLLVGNPEGYTTSFAVSAGEIRVELDPRTLLSDKLHVRLIRFQTPEITYEGVPGENNLSRILSNIREFTDRTSGGAGGDSPVEPPPRGRKLQVDEFLISDAMLHVSTPFTPAEPVSLHVEDLRLTHLGTGPDGITGPELAQRVLTELLGSTTNLVEEAFLQIGEHLEKTVPAATDPLPGAADSLLRGLPGLPPAGAR